MSKEFFWCGKLTKTQPEISVCLAPGNIPADSENFRTAVILKHIILGPTESKELNVVELSGKGFDESKLTCVIACLQATESRSFDQTRLDLTLTEESKLKLVKGEGPITVVGQFLLEFCGSPSDDEVILHSSDSDADKEEENLDEEENLESPSPPMPVAKKRKSSKSALSKDIKTKKSKNEKSDSEDESKSSKMIEKPILKAAPGTARRGRKI